jgi:hypothetical protein
MPRLLCTLSLLIVTSSVSCCPYGVWGIALRVQGDPDTDAIPPMAYQLGDTVTFIAEERFTEADCRTPAGPSNVDHDDYDWAVFGEAAEFSSPGRVVMRKPGTARLEVTTSHVSKHLESRVVDRIAAVRLTPDSVLLQPGDTVSFLVEALDANGRVIPTVNRSNGLVSLYGRTDPADPIAANQAQADPE